MKDYELLAIVSGGLSETDATAVSDDIMAGVGKLGGKVEEADQKESFWGRRRLAYPINKEDHGWYVVVRFSMEPSKLAEFQRVLNLNGKIVRTVLVSAAELPTAEEAARLKEAAEQAESAKSGDRKPAPKAPAEGDIPEEVKKTVRKAAPKAEEKPAEAEAEKTPAKDDKERQAELDEKLGEILKD